MTERKTLASIDFNLTADGEARVSIFDRGFLFGDSVYEVVRSYGGKLLALERHFQRLSRSARALGFELPFDSAKLRAHFDDLVARLGEGSCYVRVIVTRGAYDIALCPPATVTPTTVIIAETLPPWPDENYTKGITLVTVGIRRNARRSLNPMIKSGNYLNNVLATMEAREAGATDSVMLNADGKVTESSTANIFMVKNGRLITPPLDVGILDGVSRQMVIDLAKARKQPCEATEFTLDELHTADEVFITSTTREVMPVRQVDDHTFAAPGPITAAMMAAYRAHVGELLG